MNWRRSVLTLGMLAALAAPAGPLQAEILDRIVAVMDSGFIITLSDIRLERAIQTALGSPSGSDDEILDMLVERHLIEAQIAQFRQIDIDEASVEERMRTVTVPRDVTTAELRGAIEAEMRRFEFLVQRFRQFIRVSDEEARRYYEDVFVPALQQKGEPVPPLAQGMEMVRGNIIAEKMNQEVGEWLTELRRRSSVEKITQ